MIDGGRDGVGIQLEGVGLHTMFLELWWVVYLHVVKTWWSKWCME